MELGATVCTPNGAPDCGGCPLGDLCRARAAGVELTLPRRGEKKPRRREQWTVFVLHCDGRLALHRRADTGLLAGLWQLPAVPGHLNTAQATATLGDWALTPTRLHRTRTHKHLFTHIEWDMLCYFFEVAAPCDAFCWAAQAERDAQYPLPSAFRGCL